MRIFDGKEYRDMTAEEISEREKAARLAAIAEKNRSLTESEVSRMIIAQQINALPVDDQTALRMAEFYPEWTSGVSYVVGFKVQYSGKLWSVIQEHTSQDGWQPGYAAALWEEINETHSGTIDDPVPYDGNMALESGKHYIQNEIIYLCIRDTVNPVYNALAELVGVYVEMM